MELFDTVIMLTGGLLIVIGLLLFVSGTKESTSHNNVEGFGIKLNISNPSILLIVFGIGLLLVPRLLPNTEQPRMAMQKQQPREDIATAQKPEFKEPVAEPRTQANSTIEQENSSNAETEDKDSVSNNYEEDNALGWQSDIPTNARIPDSIAFLQGRWLLSTYEEDGFAIDSMDGYIDFGSYQQNTVPFTAHISSMDFWGNPVRWQTSGVINIQRGNYSISFLQSTAENFAPMHNMPLDLAIDADQRLHMQYFFGATEVLVHWFQ